MVRVCGHVAELQVPSHTVPEVLQVHGGQLEADLPPPWGRGHLPAAGEVASPIDRPGLGGGKGKERRMLYSPIYSG